MPQIQQVWQANLQVYGADKVWRQMNREGIAVARCTVERLMQRLGLAGVRRGKAVRTTIPDKALPCPLDRVNRQFKADRPNQLWISEVIGPRPQIAPKKHAAGVLWQGGKRCRGRPE